MPPVRNASTHTAEQVWAITVARAAPPDAHPQHKNEQGIQGQVDDRPQQGCHHAGSAKALGIDKGVHAQPNHHGDRAGQVDQQVALGVDHCLRAAAHQVEDGLVKEVEEDSQSRPQQYQEREADTHDPGGPFAVPLAPGDGAQGRAAGAAEVGKGVDDVGDGHHQADAREGVPPDGVNVADKRPVHHIVEYHRQLRHCQGDCQGEDVLGNPAL